MLSAESRPYIDASVPVLREHGLTITRLFYANLFNAHPELHNIFNLGNQANGLQQQSLASAVFAYAANIDNPDALAPVLSRIVHKHVSLGVTAAHYPIVGQHLLDAIQSTLGEAATPALLAAWAEAYDLLARTMIDEEARLYGASGTKPGSLFDMRITEVQQQSADIRSFVMTPADDTAPSSFRPGQYVSVAIRLPDGLRQLRQYSLSDAPGKTSLRISVKREAAGAETPAGMVSNWLHDNLKQGSILPTSLPYGDFTPDVESDAPIVLLSAGIGITPMIATLNRIAEVAPQREVIFAFATRDAQHRPHGQDLADALARMPNLKVAVFCEEGTLADGALAGRMQVAQLPQWSYADTNVYMCGPIGFMQAQWLDLVGRGVPPSHLHREVFGPDLLDHLL